MPAPEVATPAGGPGRAPQPPGERLSRRQRRRRAGIPPRVTVRVVLFLLLLAAVVAAAYGVIRWYATDNWFVTVDRDQLVIYQGRPGGLLWFNPKLVERTPVTTSEVLSIRLPALRADVDQTSLAAARSYVNTLYQEYLDQQQVNQAPATSPPTASTTPPPPPATTTVPPG